MRGLFIHTVVFAVINALLVGVWLLTTGLITELSHVQDDPVLAVRNGFWPLIVIAAWGGALVMPRGSTAAWSAAAEAPRHKTERSGRGPAVRRG